MLVIVAGGLFVSAVTIWPMEAELELALRVLGATPGLADLQSFLTTTLEGLRVTRDHYPMLLYTGDWLAFAHIVLGVLFLLATKDPVRNVLVVRFGLLCCAGVPLLAGVFIPLRGIPGVWFLVDAAFAPACAVPLLICLRDIRSSRTSGGSTWVSD